MPGRAADADTARDPARDAWLALIQLLTAKDPVPAWRSRSQRQRRAIYAVLGLVTLALAVLTVRIAPTGLSTIKQYYGPSDNQGPYGAVGTAWPVMLLGLVAVVPLPLAARYPLLAWRIGWLAFLLIPLQGYHWWGGWPWYPVQVPVLLVVFCVAGMRQQRPVLWWMWGLTLSAWWLWSGQYRPNILGHVLGSVAFTAVAIAVDSVSSRRYAQRALTVLAEETELSQAQLTVLEQRTRIARELHDVVAHHMSLIAVRAETAPYRIADLPDPVQAEFRALSGAAREALTDMRRLLGVLRQDQAASFAPQPQLSDLPSLVESARRAGVPVELTFSAVLDGVPAAVGVCAYRVVQESLSNASQHAPGAAVLVSVDRDASAVTLRVTNGSAGVAGSVAVAAKPPAQGLRRGHGLAGMRERVALLGGSLAAGPAADGGFVVSAVLPLDAAA
jgi:signal transduction histidine kinase